MTPEHIHSRLATVIAERVNRALIPSQVTLDAHLRNDLGIDSLCASELMFEIEEEFGTTVAEEDVTHFQTVRDLVQAIAHRKAA